MINIESNKGEMEIKKIQFQLETLTCPTCIKKIEGALRKTSGVSDVKVLFNSSKVRVHHDEDKLTQEDIKKIIERIGYAVLKVS